MGGLSSVQDLIDRRASILATLGALLAVGLVAGLHASVHGGEWGTLPPFLVALAALVALSTAALTYVGAARALPLAVVVPFVGLLLSHPSYVGSRDPEYSVAFAVQTAAAALVLGASWGLAGGLVGYVVGTAARTATVDAAGRPDLARRSVLVLAAAAVVAATFGTFWVRAL